MPSYKGCYKPCDVRAVSFKLPQYEVYLPKCQHEVPRVETSGSGKNAPVCERRFNKAGIDEFLIDGKSVRLQRAMHSRKLPDVLNDAMEKNARPQQDNYLRIGRSSAEADIGYRNRYVFFLYSFQIFSIAP